jgi:AraC family transcriptional regulator
MNQELTVKPRSLPTQPVTMVRLQQVDVLEVSVTKGEWTPPAVEEVSLCLALSNWHDSRGLRSDEVPAGAVSICLINQARTFEMRSATQFAHVQLRNEAMEQAWQETHQHIGAELQANEIIQDLTLRRLMKVLLHEKRSGFQSGSLFLDGVAAALASYLVRHYSVDPPVERNSVGGMRPSMLRRCIELMEARLEGDLRLSELARETNLSASHLIRSFRQSTGKTPYQFLLHRRVERAKILMRDHRTPLIEVGLASGFADKHHFSRVFRRVTGMTPGSYRRSL